MAVPKHLGEAAARLKEASAPIGEARSQATTLEGTRQWLAALTDFAMALSDIQAFNNESVHEKLHAVAGHVGFEELPPGAAKSG